MTITPLLTEKTMNSAKEGKYTFMVEVGLNKFEITKLVNKVFNVHVKSIKTMNHGASVKRNVRGRKVSVKATKKAIVTLAKDEKIDAFEVKKGKK